MVTLSVIVDAVVLNFDNDLKSLQAISSKKQTFYMSEGARALVTVLLEGFLMNNSDPTADEIATYLDDSLAQLIPSPYVVSPVQVGLLKTTPSSVISSGPFKGMNGPITDLQIKLNVSRPSTLFGGDMVEPLEMRLSIGYVSMFQFMAFYDVTKGEINTGPPMDMNGRLHSNGDMCIGGSGGYETFLKVTVGGRLMLNTDGRCGNGGFNRARISTTQNFGPFADLTASADNGCTNCNGTGLNWDAFAVARWNEQALDQAHGVQLLKLPGAGEGLVQAQRSGGGVAVNNTDNLRFIVDPPLASDSTTVKSYKYAHNADLRIINGVWYVRVPAQPTLWPGYPIWSDHPGRYVENGVNVGQDDIRDFWAQPQAWPAPPLTRSWPVAPMVPRKFSYYEYDKVAQTIMDDAVGEGVVSYGTLVNSGAGTTPQKPGHWIRNFGAAPGTSPMCLGDTLDCGPGGCGLKSVWQGGTYGCSGLPIPGRDPSYASNILNGTRGGFRNGHIVQTSPGPQANRDQRSRILPINFDIQQLQNALADTSAGELGSYFGVGNFTNEPFNGVIWISSQWPGSENGYGGGGPQEWPWQGSVNDPLQIDVTHPAVQRALPQPLCSTSLAGQSYDRQGPLALGRDRFKIPDCAGYGAAGATKAWPNAVRLINGANFDKTRLPKGLSIVSNLPTYLVGNYNTNSVVTNINSTPWLPALVGGDKIALISNSWSDSRSEWDLSPNSTHRAASNTTYNTALLHEPSDTLTVLLEDWTNRNLLVNGSMVFGFNAVYALHSNQCCGDQTYDPPDRDFIFDPHFGLISNQPPGTPVFPVSAIAVWSKAQ